MSQVGTSRLDQRPAARIRRFCQAGGSVRIVGDAGCVIDPRGSFRMDCRYHGESIVDNTVLALLFFTSHQQDEYGARVWQGHDWGVLDRLHQGGFISNPVSKAKSVAVTPEGLAKGRELFASLFLKDT